MRHILKKLGFAPMSQFIEKELNLRIDCNGIFIKCQHRVPELSTKKAMNNLDILSHALEVCDDRNQLCNGYCKATKKWYSTNTTRNLLKSKKWARIFSDLGYEYSVFVLTKCSIVEEVGQNLIFVCGDFGENIEKRQSRVAVNRERLFHGRDGLAQVSLESVVQEILVSEAWNNDEIVSRLFKVFSRFNRIPLKSLFKSFFGQRKNIINSAEQDDIIRYQIDPKDIADFLFMVSKKFLRPVFGMRDFRVLKGKIVLLLKRNIRETVYKEELTKYLKVSKSKLFREVEGLSLASKTRILENFLLFIFNRIYLNILSFFFYSTTSSFSKYKVMYFTRAEWDRSVSKFISNYLKQFTRVGVSSRFSTLRCIPKESGFRVVFNCSKLCSNSSRMIEQHEAHRNNQDTKHSTDSRSLLLSIERIRQKYEEIDAIFQGDPGSVYSLHSFSQHASSDIRSILQDDTRSQSTKSKNDCMIEHECLTGSHFSTEGSAAVEYVDRKSLTKENMRLRRPKNIVSINSTVASILPILKKESLESTGYSLLDHRDVKARLFSFLRSSEQRLYMVKVDLDRCFDNIPQKDLASILGGIFKKDMYYFQELVLLREGDINDKVTIKYIRSTPDLLYPINMMEGSFCDGTMDPDMNVIIKENKSKAFSKSDLLSRIGNVVENTTVYYQNAYYKSTRGIPQGCSISPILCAVYYGHLDREFKHMDGFISRFVDDFLVVSSRIDAIREFFRVAHTLRDKGFIINKKKICANFDIDTIFDDTVPGTSTCLQKDDAAFTANHIEWCGMKIYDRETGLKSALGDKYFRYSVYVSRPNIGRMMFVKVQKLLEIKCSSVYINKMNSKSGENIFDAFYFVGRKLRIMILRSDFVNTKFVEKVLSWCVERVKETVRKRRMILDDWKIESMAKKAFERCEVCKIRKRAFGNI